MTAPALYDCTVRHTRTTPLRHAFTYRTYQWFVDLDELPRDRLLASFRAADHFGDPARTIRANVEAYLARHGIDLAGGPIRLLTNARSFGYVFNPLSVYWCHRADGSLAAVIAEVHNTYGGRHCYLLHTDERGRAETAKAFYVSPFNDVSGEYRLTLPEPGGRLALTVALDRDGGRPFVASLRGRRRPATGLALLGAAVRHPFVTVAVAVRIRLQGIRLYLRGLPVVPRTEGPR
ncbi:DUF1365 domain-containing protein [Paractinoplanes durhamensis]|uniref:DUF1365 domain-containing protein n=1 Tax=Paractinoplanes durhamensis TaxID=113563 RepID=A0ABQ3Z5F6_9ACTN|nr:DUF1365 domain-containing protein [Actinoplanes durhamensis]GIE05068.1 DUF1365 domain-containing protein [Actinoplanes durhamensis]